MEIIEAAQRPPALIRQLTALWQQSVSATHTFLTQEDILRIKDYVPPALADIPLLLLAVEQGQTIGFAGVAGQKLEMLFLAPDCRGRGHGRAVMQQLIVRYAVREVCVNEQNPAARGFYEHMGFAVYRRTLLDEQGSPFLLLYLRLAE